MNLRPEMARQTKQFEAETPMGRMATVDEFGRAGHLFVEPSGILLHGRRPDCRRRLPLLVRYAIEA
jgi:hypothetical protein